MFFKALCVLFSVLAGIMTYFALRKFYQDVILKYHKAIKIQAQQEYLFRQEAYVMQENLSGAKKEKGLFFQLDRVLDEIGVRRKWSYLTAEIYLFLLSIVVVILTILIYLITKNFFYLFLTVVVYILLNVFALYVLSGYFYKRTEKQLLIFINLLDNYAKTSDDLVEIIGKSAVYLQEPLRSAVSEFHWEAVHTGEIDAALRHLTLKLSHNKLKEIIRNLDICRRHEANYAEIINDLRISIKEYLASKEERKSIYANARVSVLIMLFVGIFILRLVDNFIGGELWALMLQSNAGVLIVAYLAAVLVGGIKQFLKIDRS